MLSHAFCVSAALLVLLLLGSSSGKIYLHHPLANNLESSSEFVADDQSPISLGNHAFGLALSLHWSSNATRFVADLRKPYFVPSRTKIRRHRRPCAYYPNSSASFHLPLVGDLVFKLNPGPERQRDDCDNYSHCGRKHKGTLPTQAGITPLSFCLFNSRSVENKSADIIDYICECKADLVAITETWLHVNGDAVRQQVCPVNYKISDHPRTGRRGGGVALMYRLPLKVDKTDAGEKQSFEFGEWTVQLKSSHNLRVVLVYRPPYSEEHKVPMGTFLAEFSDYLESIVLCQEQLLIVGDFNIHVDVDNDYDSINFRDLLESFGLQQHVTHPTHIHGHTLDLIITRQSDQLIKSTPRVDRFISDHASILCSLRSSAPSFTTKIVSYRKLKAINIELLNDDLSNTDLCQNPPSVLDDLVDCYNDTLRTTLNKHAPLISKTIKERARVPWFNKEIREAKRQRRKAERKWRTSKLESDLRIFKIKRNAATRLMTKARIEYYTDLIEENSINQKKLFRESKRLFHNAVDDGLPPNLDCGNFANDLGNYFVQKITCIRSRLDDENTCQEDRQQTAPENSVTNQSAVPSFTEFAVLSESDVKALIRNSSLKSCPLDPMPSQLVSQCEALLPVITFMLNSSLQGGIFPANWKEALVFPLLKKHGLDIAFKNFRPVSNLPFTSKLAEKAVFNQIHEHMTTYKLYPTTQSAYRKSHSTETALLRIKNDILLAMNKQHVTILVLLDLSAAFDTVDHGVMLETLSSKLGICGSSLDWFSSYLHGRSQRVSVRDCISEKFNLMFGVPQGSCLGPLLFTIYSSKLFDVIKGHLPSVHCYADDTQLYVSFSPKQETSQSEAITAIESCVQDIRKWMVHDKLLLNDDKTEFLLIGTKQQLAKVNIDHITIGDAEIAPQSPVRNLGVWFDSSLSMKEHITKTCSSAFYWLYNIRKIRKYLSRKCTEILVHAFISSRIDYCNSLLYGLPACQLNKVQRIQNAAARIIFQEGKYCHITPLLHSLHWLPVSYRIDYKILLIAFKAIHRLAPEYICELISVKPKNKYGLRSNDNGILLSRPTFKSYATLGDRSFRVAAPKVWNSLPFNIRTAEDIGHFKRSLKTFLFKKAFIDFN